MDEAGYWANISWNGRRLGAGFRLTGSYVLTAHHCLDDAGPQAEDVDVEFEDREPLPGRVHRRAPMADLALIDVPESGLGPFSRAVTGRPTGRPGGILTGQAAATRFSTERAPSVELRQVAPPHRPCRAKCRYPRRPHRMPR
jgi:hypothetical protein